MVSYVVPYNQRVDILLMIEITHKQLS